LYGIYFAGARVSLKKMVEEKRRKKVIIICFVKISIMMVVK
jgi:hypothetical protein